MRPHDFLRYFKYNGKTAIIAEINVIGGKYPGQDEISNQPEKPMIVTWKKANSSPR